MKAILFARSECSTVVAHLDAYVDGQLHDSRQKKLEAHVRDCPHCATELQRLLALREQIHRNLEVSLPGEDAARFWDNVERKIQEAKAPEWWRVDRLRELFWFYPKLWWASAAVLGTTVLLFTAELVLRPSIPPPTSLAPMDAPPRTVVESVEGGPNSSVVLFSTPDQQLKIIWVLERERS
jgi:anti-sigma factor RsiW